MTIKVKIIKPNGKIPKRATPQSAGLDIYSAECTVVAPNNKAIISTGIQLQLPNNVYGRIAPRSGLAAKHFIHVGAGVIDSDYRGEIKVLLFNHSSENFAIKTGDKIAQLIPQLITYPVLEEIENDIKDTNMLVNRPDKKRRYSF